MKHLKLFEEFSPEAESSMGAASSPTGVPMRVFKAAEMLKAATKNFDWADARNWDREMVVDALLQMKGIKDVKMVNDLIMPEFVKVHPKVSPSLMKDYVFPNNTFNYGKIYKKLVLDKGGRDPFFEIYWDALLPISMYASKDPNFVDPDLIYKVTNYLSRTGKISGSGTTTFPEDLAYNGGYDYWQAHGYIF